jgi:hypothetical protein
MCSTCAPCPARVQPSTMPAMTWVNEATFRPDNGRASSVSAGSSGSLSPILTISTSGLSANIAPWGCDNHSSGDRQIDPIMPCSAAASSSEVPLPHVIDGDDLAHHVRRDVCVLEPWTQTQRVRRSVMFVHDVEALLIGLQKHFPASRSTFQCPGPRCPAPFVSGGDYDESKSSSSTRYPVSLSTSGTSSRHAMSPKCS